MSKICVLAVLFVYSAITYAQSTNPLDEMYTPPKSSIFGTSKVVNIKNPIRSDGSCYNFIRVSLVDFASSQLRIVYERRMNDKISATASIGTVFGNDYIQMYMAGDEIYEDFLSNNNIDALKLPDLLEHSINGGGYLYSTSFKYRIGDDYIASPFIEIWYKFVHRNYRVNDQFQNISISDRNFNTDFKYFSVNCGYDWVYGEGRTRFTHELSIGIGLKLFSWDQYDLIKDTQTGSYKYDKNNDMRMSFKCPYFALTYQMGLGW